MAWASFFTELVEVFDRRLGERSRPSRFIEEAAAQGDAIRLLAAAEHAGEKIRRREPDIAVPVGLSVYGNHAANAPSLCANVRPAMGAATCP